MPIISKRTPIKWGVGGQPSCSIAKGNGREISGSNGRFKREDWDEFKDKHLFSREELLLARFKTVAHNKSGFCYLS